MSKSGMKLVLVSVLLIFMLPLTAPAQNGTPINARIGSISPGIVKPGDKVVIIGSFGKMLEPGRGYKVIRLFDRQNEKVGHMKVEGVWGEHEITAIAPYGLKAQRYRVRICDGVNQCSNEKTLRLQAPDRAELGFDGPVLLGFRKRPYDPHGGVFYLEPHEVRFLPDGKIDLDIYYTFAELNGLPAHGFENTISWAPMIGRDAKKLREDKNLSLPAFGKKTIATHITLPKPDDSIVYVQLDRGKQVRETGYKDNMATVYIRFKGFERPDLIINEIKRVGPKPKVGRPVTFDIQIKNQGNAKSALTMIGYRVGGSTKINSVPLQGMMPNSLRTVRITTGSFSKAQNYRITVIANQDHRVQELRTDNNEKYETFTVSK